MWFGVLQMANVEKNKLFVLGVVVAKTTTVETAVYFCYIGGLHLILRSDK